MELNFFKKLKFKNFRKNILFNKKKILQIKNFKNKKIKQEYKIFFYL